MTKMMYKEGTGLPAEEATKDDSSAWRRRGNLSMIVCVMLPIRRRLHWQRGDDGQDGREGG